MEQEKGGRTLERATQAVYSGLAALATGHGLLGLKDISTYDTEKFRFTLEPLTTSVFTAGTLAAGALAYFGISQLTKRFERKTAENADDERKEIRAKGCLFAAPLIGIGLLGAAYNHDSLPIPHLDPTPIIEKIPTELTTADPERKRNLRFLKKHLVTPSHENLDSEPVKHQHHITIGTNTFTLHDHDMAGHPDFTGLHLYLPGSRINFIPLRYGNTESYWGIMRLTADKKAQLIEVRRRERTDSPLEEYLRTSAPDKYCATLTITDPHTLTPLITHNNVIIRDHQEYGPSPKPKLIYAQQDQKRWRINVIDLETLTDRPATAEDRVVWGPLGPIEAPK